MDKFWDFKKISDCKGACGLQICYPNCQNFYETHDAEECLLIKKIPDKSSSWLTILRLLKFKKSPQEWKRILLLEDHIDDRKECQIMKNNRNTLYPLVKMAFEGISTESIDLRDYIVLLW